MDLKSWKDYKRSGTYRREVLRQYQQVTSLSKSDANNESEVRAKPAQCGSAQNFVYMNEDNKDPSYVQNKMFKRIAAL